MINMTFEYIRVKRGRWAFRGKEVERGSRETEATTGNKDQRAHWGKK
jgi:hypothetical protein